jgi:hypothetical protein
METRIFDGTMAFICLAETLFVGVVVMSSLLHHSPTLHTLLVATLLPIGYLSRAGKLWHNARFSHVGER